ncbi:hypothetical protein FHR24_003015 [Wenyingzhuangia heitensis]|uniref:Mobilization protein n=1 Tax=Wenyingzhuangia heitensis TaxID=1487859 RepID=A0ABX0UGK4_9FLAO|nr:DUF5712 family protein [Wenyingzhuangia heitensis]NIJ46526.1 hypothetical protein [Wenyingzhuangia heitensis]
MPISKPHSTLGATNTGSSYSLVMYLEKENIELEKKLDFSEFQIKKQPFFNHERNDFNAIDVIDKIDNNKKKLGKEDAKYFAPTINFSQSELEHLSKIASSKVVKEISEFNTKEFLKYNSLIKQYAKKVMDNYAVNFNRQDKGLKSGADLVYFGKVEHYRKFKGHDSEVKNGSYNSGNNKPGLNSHIHLVVSRKDITQKMKLSPLANEKHTINRVINGNSYSIGFDRLKWIERNEAIFDKIFNYKRPLLEQFVNQNILKNGSPEQKHELNEKLEKSRIVTNKHIISR